MMAPVFGVAPCPTVIFTLGVLVCCARPVWHTVVAPLVWAGIATTAAFKLGMTEDFGLIASAVVAVVVFWVANRQQAQAERLWRETAPERFERSDAVSRLSVLPSSTSRPETGR